MVFTWRGGGDLPYPDGHNESHDSRAAAGRNPSWRDQAICRRTRLLAGMYPTKTSTKSTHRTTPTLGGPLGRIASCRGHERLCHGVQMPQHPSLPLFEACDRASQERQYRCQALGPGGLMYLSLYFTAIGTRKNAVFQLTETQWRQRGWPYCCLADRTS